LIPWKMSLTKYINPWLVPYLLPIRLGLLNIQVQTYCLLIGIVLFIIQLLFCTWWLKTHKQGPLETCIKLHGFLGNNKCSISF
jgi:uncharacterized protein